MTNNKPFLITVLVSNTGFTPETNSVKFTVKKKNCSCGCQKFTIKNKGSNILGYFNENTSNVKWHAGNSMKL